LVVVPESKQRMMSASTVLTSTPPPLSRYEGGQGGGGGHAETEKDTTKRTDLKRRVMEETDLDIDNYNSQDLFRLFGLKQEVELTDALMKECRKIVLKTHPDKARIDGRYFVFFMKAYNRLKMIADYQQLCNHSSSSYMEMCYDTQQETQSQPMTSRQQKRADTILSRTMDDFALDDESCTKLMETFFRSSGSSRKDQQKFDLEWFNRQFDLAKTLDEPDMGYGDWLKSDQDMMSGPSSVDGGKRMSKTAMNAAFETHKQQLQQLTIYTGVQDVMARDSGGTSLAVAFGGGGKGHQETALGTYTSGALFASDGMGYTDLKQAYIESVIPVSESMYDNMPKFSSVDEYKRHRDTMPSNPFSKLESERILRQQMRYDEQLANDQAHLLAKESERNQRKQQLFFTGMQRLEAGPTGGQLVTLPAPENNRGSLVPYPSLKK
jgi:hypothetical protein